MFINTTYTLATILKLPHNLNNINIDTAKIPCNRQETTLGHKQGAGY